MNPVIIVEKSYQDNLEQSLKSIYNLFSILVQDKEEGSFFVEEFEKLGQALKNLKILE